LEGAPTIPAKMSRTGAAWAQWLSCLLRATTR
jgi:hypothetical protein